MDTAALLGLGILLEISLLIMWGVTKLDRTSALLETYFAIPFAIYLITVVWIVRSKRENFYSSVIIIVLISTVMYATFLLQQTPTLSGDLYRYIWDGKLINNDISPYRYPPDASQLSYLRDSNWQLVENNNIVSPYPPLLELLNALTYRLSPTVLAFKTLTVVFALGSIIALPFFLRRLQFDPRLSAIFAWNPLFVLEFGSSAHDDSMAIFLVLVSFYLLTNNRKIPSAAVMALAVVSKLFPLLIVPLLLKRWGIRATALLIALVVSFYVPFILLGGSVVAPISQYVFTSTPLFNAGAFALIQSAFSSLGSSGAVLAARAVEYSIFGAVLAWMLWQVLREDLDDIRLIRYSGILITVYIAFSSTVQPWYLSWVFVPFLVMMPAWSWIIFSGTIFLTYLTFTQQPLAPGYWAEIIWVTVVEFAQLYSVIAYEIFARKYFVPFRGKFFHSEEAKTGTAESTHQFS
jgi:alpha-1,6-mannosyltransferase